MEYLLAPPLSRRLLPSVPGFLAPSLPRSLAPSLSSSAPFARALCARARREHPPLSCARAGMSSALTQTRVRMHAHLNIPDPLLRNLFSTSMAFWRNAFQEGGPSAAASAEKAAVSELVLASLGGGERDTLVGTERSDVYQLCPPSHCLSVSTTALAGAWLSVDHRASLWCNQVVRVLTGSLRALAVRDRAGWRWETRQPAKMEALRRRLLPGTHMLQGLSLTAPHQAQQPVPPSFSPEETESLDTPLWEAWNLESWKVHLLPHGSSPPQGSDARRVGADGGGGGAAAMGKGATEAESYLRIPAVEEEAIYVWRLRGVASGDGHGASLAVVSSLELKEGEWRNWRVVLCGPEVDTMALRGDASELARACLKPGGRAQDVSGRAVELKGGGCHARWNADCVPSEPAAGGVRWVLSVGAHELRPLQVVCVVGPRKTRAAGGQTPHAAGWLAALRLVPPASAHDKLLPTAALFGWSWRPVDPEQRGAWYVPMASLPGSLSPVPATIVVEHLDSSVCASSTADRAGGGGGEGIGAAGAAGGEPLFKPVVLHTSEEAWQDSIGEGWARAEVQVGDPVQVWRQQRRSAWLSNPAPAAVVLLTDPHCRYQVGIRGNVWAALGLGLRRHMARLIPLAAAALCLRRVFARTQAAGDQLSARAPCLASVMTALWLLVLVHPVLVCVLWASCAQCRSLWGCTVGASVVSDLMSHAAREWGWAGAWRMGNRDSANWSHVEHVAVSGLLVAAATGLSLVLVGVARGIAWLLAKPAPLGAVGSGSAWRWWSCTVALALLGVSHPVLAGVCLLFQVLTVPAAHAPGGGGGGMDGEEERRGGQSRGPPPVAGASARAAAGEEDTRTLGALAILCIIVRMPGLVALIRCLAISTKSLHAAWDVLCQDRLGPALQFVAGGELGEGAGWAVPVDVLVSAALPVAARVRAWRLRSTPVQGAGARGVGWVEGVWCVCCALGILLAQEDVFVILWATLLFLVRSGTGAVGPQKAIKSQ